MSEQIEGRIRARRQELGLTQEGLAERVGLQGTAVNHFESGRRSPSLGNLIRLADALDCSIDWLVGRKVGGTGESETGLVAAYRRLSPAAQKMLVRIARTLGDA